VGRARGFGAREAAAPAGLLRVPRAHEELPRGFNRFGRAAGGGHAPWDPQARARAARLDGEAGGCAPRLRARCGHEPGCGAGGAGEAAGQRGEAARAVPLRRR